MDSHRDGSWTAFSYRKYDLVLDKYGFNLRSTFNQLGDFEVFYPVLVTSPIK